MKTSDKLVAFFLWGLAGLFVFVPLAQMLWIKRLYNFYKVTLLQIILLFIIYMMIKNLLLMFNPHKKFKFNKIKKNKITPEFKQIYNYIKTQHSEELEEDRKKSLEILIKGIIIDIVSVILGVLLLFLGLAQVAIICIIVIPVSTYWAVLAQNKKNAPNYKKRIIKNFIKCINPNLYYDEKAETSLMDEYYESGFDEDNYVHFFEDDYICGYIGDNEESSKIEISNIILGLADKDEVFSEISYEGIFSVTKLNYDLTEEIRIKSNPDRAKQKENKVQKVQMDSREFEKYFDVYAESDILAMKLLTHDVMEELVKFFKEFKIKFEINIKNSKIYIRFDTGMMFEPTIIRKSYNIKTLWVYYSVLQFIIYFTAKINELLKDLEV